MSKDTLIDYLSVNTVTQMQSEQITEEQGSVHFFSVLICFFLLQDWVGDVRNELVKAHRNKNKLKEMYEGMYKNLGNLETPGHGLLRKRFIQVCVITE